ncbi:MAG: MarR family transcriptional regulator [SAR324 cluster bacterium]|nr:MarR family transcriptional regulator [SAR324 cluster bacterium]
MSTAVSTNTGNCQQAGPKKSSAGSGDPVNYGVLPQTLGYLLRRSQIMLFQHFAATVGKKEITPGQQGLLILISCNPGISQTALAKAAGIERSTLGEVMVHLEKQGWVERNPSDQDRRSYALSLSPSGERFLSQTLALAREHEAELTSHLTSEEQRTLTRILQKLLNRS